MLNKNMFSGIQSKRFLGIYSKYILCKLIFCSVFCTKASVEMLVSLNRASGSDTVDGNAISFTPHLFPRVCCAITFSLPSSPLFPSLSARHSQTEWCVLSCCSSPSISRGLVWFNESFTLLIAAVRNRPASRV